MSEKEWWAEASKAAAYRHQVREHLFKDCGGENDLMRAGRQASRNDMASTAFPSVQVRSGRVERRADADSNRWIEWD